MQTLTLANIYELQGLKEEALEIYKKILRNDPNNSCLLYTSPSPRD